MSQQGLLCTEEELGAMSLSTDERMQAVLGGGSDEDVLRMYSKIEETWRGFASNVEIWTWLTMEFLFETFGSFRPKAELQLERVAELAARRGIDTEQLALIRDLLAGPDNLIRQRLETTLATGERAAAWRAWGLADAAMRDAVTIRCENVNDALGYVLREHGDEVMENAMMYAAERGFWREALPAQTKADPKDLVRDTAFFLSAGAGCTIRVTEDDDRFTVHKLDCHCGRLVIDARKHGWKLEVVEGPSPMTYGQPAMTPFQSHFAVIHGMWVIDVAGAPAPPFDCLGMNVGLSGHCRNYVYKTAIPDHFYDVLGRRRPDAS